MPIRIALLALLLGGCIPDLSAWYIQTGDAGPVPQGDGGVGGGEPNPLDLGPPCPNPHVLVSTLGGTSDTARLLRFDPGTGARCRDSALVETQRAFGYAIYDVDWHPDTGVVLGLADAVLGLDDEGFPAWRYARFGHDELRGEWVAVFGRGADTRIAVAWTRSSSSIDRMRLLDASGVQTSGDIEPPFSSAMIAAQPDGSPGLLMPTKSGVEVAAFALTDATTRLPDSGEPLWTAGEDLPQTYGPRAHLDTDLETGRVVITHQQGVAFWTMGGPPPRTVYACGSHCESFHAAAAGPERGAYAICLAGSERHLVHLDESSCTLVLDGTSLGSQRLQDVKLVRAAL